jgi:hypothetical protein
MVRVRNSCSLPASSSLPTPKLLVVGLGVQRMRGQVAERLLDAMDAELVLHRLERGGDQKKSRNFRLRRARITEAMPLDTIRYHEIADISAARPAAPSPRCRRWRGNGRSPGGCVTHASPTLTKHEIDRNVHPHRLATPPRDRAGTAARTALSADSSSAGWPDDLRSDLRRPAGGVDQHAQHHRALLAGRASAPDRSRWAG